MTEITPITTKGPHPDDVAAGQRLRVLRLQRNVSQEALAEAIGVSFQQVQKYEKGTNRISLSRLFAICRHLKVAPEEFSPVDMAATAPASPQDAASEHWLRGHEAFELAALLSPLPEDVRKSVINVAKATAGAWASMADRIAGERRPRKAA